MLMSEEKCSSSGANIRFSIDVLCSDLLILEQAAFFSAFFQSYRNRDTSLLFEWPRWDEVKIEID